MALGSRNLLRGRVVGLPAGQDLATAIGATPLIPSDFERSVESDVVAAHGFDRRTRCGFYILKEAQTHADGERLGEVGGRILAEVFIGLLEGDPDSFLVAQPDWTRTLPAATQGPSPWPTSRVSSTTSTRLARRTCGQPSRSALLRPRLDGSCSRRRGSGR